MTSNVVNQARLLYRKVKKLKRDIAWTCASKALAHDENLYDNLHNAPMLTKGEIQEVKDTWDDVCPCYKVGLSGFKAYKMHYGFDVRYVPFSYFFPWMVRVLNPIDSTRALEHKGMAYTYFKGIPMPALIVKRIGSSFLDSEGNALSDCEMLRFCQGGGVIKPALGSCCGNGVSLIKPGLSISELQKMIARYSGDFVIQRVLSQSDETKCFNSSSLNTFRISTLYLNGKFSVCTSMLRFGTAGNVVDNVGAGGGCVGICDDGSLMPYGFNKAGYKIHEWNGVAFAGRKIKSFNKVFATAKAAHGRIPVCAFVGWDLAIDENGDVNIIEANLDWPGLFFEQLANGRPAFGDRFDEVLYWVKCHQLPLMSLYDVVV